MNINIIQILSSPDDVHQWCGLHSADVLSRSKLVNHKLLRINKLRHEKLRVASSTPFELIYLIILIHYVKMKLFQ